MKNGTRVGVMKTKRISSHVWGFHAHLWGFSGTVMEVVVGNRLRSWVSGSWGEKKRSWGEKKQMIGRLNREERMKRSWPRGS